MNDRHTRVLKMLARLWRFKNVNDKSLNEMCVRIYFQTTKKNRQVKMDDTLWNDEIFFVGCWMGVLNHTTKFRSGCVDQLLYAQFRLPDVLLSLWIFFLKMLWKFVWTKRTEKPIFKWRENLNFFGNSDNLNFRIQFGFSLKIKRWLINIRD